MTGGAVTVGLGCTTSMGGGGVCAVGHVDALEGLVM